VLHIFAVFLYVRFGISRANPAATRERIAAMKRDRAPEV
jgi:hypothetical protein